MRIETEVIFREWMELRRRELALRAQVSRARKFKIATEFGGFAMQAERWRTTHEAERVACRAHGKVAA